MYCDMTDKNGVGVTVVGHDSEARTLVNGYEGQGTYSRDVHYIATGLTSMPQLAGLATASTNCEQFIKYECMGNPILYNGVKYGWWVSRNQEDMNYWGGATPADTYKCACGLTNSCADPNDGCNCDIDDSEWRKDSGFLTEKSDLPVIQLRFGDTGNAGEEGYHTLGKFKCYGTTATGTGELNILTQSQDGKEFSLEKLSNPPPPAQRKIKWLTPNYPDYFFNIHWADQRKRVSAPSTHTTILARHTVEFRL